MGRHADSGQRVLRQHVRDDVLVTIRLAATLPTLILKQNEKKNVFSTHCDIFENRKKMNKASFKKTFVCTWRKVQIKCK